MAGRRRVPTVAVMEANPRILVVGGGVAGLETIMGLRALAEDRVDLTLVTPERTFTYRPLAVLSPFGATGPQRFPLELITAEHDVAFVRDTLHAVDLDRAVVHTQGGDRFPYDELVLAIGGVLREAVPGALTFRGPQDAPLLQAALSSGAERIAFVVPPGTTWSLPAYELALLAAAECRRLAPGTRLALLTPEHAPLAAFGPAAGAAVAAELAAAGVELDTDTLVESFDDGHLRLGLQGSVRVDHVIALPRIEGSRVAGMPYDKLGFLPVDEWCRVRGTDVYAAGDATDLPVKQGGLAAQQADTIAAVLAARAGAAVTPAPLRPVLRGLLLTGAGSRYLHRLLEADDGAVSSEPLWWPPNKIAGRYLAPYLASRLDIALPEGGSPLAVSAPVQSAA